MTTNDAQWRMIAESNALRVLRARHQDEFDILFSQEREKVKRGGPLTTDELLEYWEEFRRQGAAEGWESEFYDAYNFGRYLQEEHSQYS